MKRYAVLIISVIIIFLGIISIIKHWKKIESTTNNNNVNSQKSKDTNTKANTEDNRDKLYNTLVDGKWKLIWNDEFDTNKIDVSKWNVENRKDNYNSELQMYSQDNITQDNGVLDIIGKKEKKDGKNYTSGLIDTRNKFTFSNGRIDIRAKIPVGKGLFPAIWMLPNDASKKYPEIDVMEMIGQEPKNIYGVVHYEENGVYKRSYNVVKIEKCSDYHIYSFQWEQSSLKWLIDGKEYQSASINIPHEDMYLIINLAIGGNWPGSPNENTAFPTNFVIDYIRVYMEVSK